MFPAPNISHIYLIRLNTLLVEISIIIIVFRLGLYFTAYCITASLMTLRDLNCFPHVNVIKLFLSSSLAQLPNKLKRLNIPTIVKHDSLFYQLRH